MLYIFTNFVWHLLKWSNLIRLISWYYGQFKFSRYFYRKMYTTRKHIYNIISRQELSLNYVSINSCIYWRAFSIILANPVSNVVFMMVLFDPQLCRIWLLLITCFEAVISHFANRRVYSEWRIYSLFNALPFLEEKVELSRLSIFTIYYAIFWRFRCVIYII